MQAEFEAYLAWRKQQTQGGPAGGAGGAVGPTTATPWAPTKFIAAPGVQTAAGTPTKAHETPKSAKVQKRGANVDFNVFVNFQSRIFSHRFQSRISVTDPN